MSDEPAGKPVQPLRLDYAAPADPWPARMASGALAAVALFFLGAVSLCVGNLGSVVAGAMFFVLPFVALVLGIAARQRAARDDDDVQSQSRYAITIASFEIAIVLAAAIILPQFGRP